MHQCLLEEQAGSFVDLRECPPNAFCQEFSTDLVGPALVDGNHPPNLLIGDHGRV
ncbi:hypothetical protein D9M71_739120 [compost metagenome]